MDCSIWFSVPLSTKKHTRKLPWAQREEQQNTEKDPIWELKAWLLCIRHSSGPQCARSTRVPPALGTCILNLLCVRARWVAGLVWGGVGGVRGILLEFEVQHATICFFLSPRVGCVLRQKLGPWRKPNKCIESSAGIQFFLQIWSYQTIIISQLLN